MKLLKAQDYLLLIDEEAEIKENTNTFKEGFNGDWFWNSKYNSIQRTGDITEFDFKIIAYYPLNSEAKELDLPLLPNPFKNTIDIEKLALKELGYENDLDITNEAWEDVNTFIRGYKAAQSKGQYSLEDIKDALNQLADEAEYGISNFARKDIITKIIQSLSTQQLPKEFIPEYEEYAIGFYGMSNGEPTIDTRLRTITNSEGKRELVGTYKY